MHPTALVDLVHSVKRRIKQGDWPTEPPLHMETLEEMVSDLWDLWQRELTRRKIERDPDDEPSAGAGGDFGLTDSGTALRETRKGMMIAYLAKLPNERDLLLDIIDRGVTENRAGSCRSCGTELEPDDIKFGYQVCAQCSARSGDDKP
jgi:ribosomal protein L40E